VDLSSDIANAIENLEDRDLIRLTQLVQAELRDRVRIYRIMGRLTDKLALAAGVAPKHAAAIEARADRIIAADPEMERMTEEAFLPHESLLDEAQKGLDDLKHQLATMSNLPPLSASEGSSKVCPRCINGSKPRLLGDGNWVHDISVNGNHSISQEPCLNPPQ
jgi:hypothetical protein